MVSHLLTVWTQTEVLSGSLQRGCLWTAPPEVLWGFMTAKRTTDSASPLNHTFDVALARLGTREHALTPCTSSHRPTDNQAQTTVGYSIVPMS